MSDTTTQDDDARQAAPTEPAHAPGVGPDSHEPETRTEAAPGADETSQDDTKPADKPTSPPDSRDRAIRQLAFEKREAIRELQALRAEQAQRNPRDPNAPPTQADFDRHVEERAAQLIAQRQSQEKREAWVVKGNADFADFSERCNQLADMGVREVPGFMDAIDELPDGHRVLANLAENPAEVARIMKLPAIPMALELARLSAKLAAAPPPAPKPTTQAPPPIRPIQTTSRAEVRLENLEGDDFKRAWNIRTKGRA